MAGEWGTGGKLETFNAYIICGGGFLAILWLGHHMYRLFGPQAFIATLPFVGTLLLVFAVAHYLDKQNEQLDKEKASPEKTAEAKSS
jgi:hypothetical protein